MPKRILIIEDDKLIASLIKRTLIQEGFEIDHALDGEEGLKKIEKQIPDVVLLDLILPGLNGFEVLEKLKKEEKTKQIPVVILSNLGNQDDVAKGFRLGADAYLIKAEILPEDVVKKLEEIFQRKKD